MENIQSLIETQNKLIKQIEEISAEIKALKSNQISPSSACNPGGSDKEVQINNSGAFSGYPSFKFDDINGVIELIQQSTPNDWIILKDASLDIRAKLLSRGRWGTFASFGGRTDNRLGEIFFYDVDSATSGDGATHNCDWTGTEYDWHWDFVVNGSGIRALSVNMSQGVNSGAGLFSVAGTPGVTGTIRDSSNNPLAEVVGGIITTIY